MSELFIDLCFVRHAETEANAAGIRQVTAAPHMLVVWGFNGVTNIST